MRLGVLAATVLVSVPAVAQQAITGAEIRELVSGRTVDFSRDGSASYAADGQYEFYNKNNGATSRGKWSVQGDRLCVDFDNGVNRCDQFVRSGSGVALKNARGQTFPVIVR